jgi:hypothetical protein
MFLKHGTKNLNEIEMVAPTGFGIRTCFLSCNLRGEPWPSKWES